MGKCSIIWSIFICIRREIAVAKRLYCFRSQQKILRGVCGITGRQHMFCLCFVYVDPLFPLLFVLWWSHLPCSLMVNICFVYLLCLFFSSPSFLLNTTLTHSLRLSLVISISYQLHIETTLPSSLHHAPWTYKGSACAIKGGGLW